MVAYVFATPKFHILVSGSRIQVAGFFTPDFRLRSSDFFAFLLLPFALIKKSTHRE